MAKHLRSLFSNTIKKRLILSFTLILLVPSLAIAAFSYSTAKQTVDNELGSSANENVSLLNATITKFIQPQIDNMEFMAGQITTAMYQDDQPVLRTQLMAPFMKTHPDISNIDFGATNGFYANAANQKMPDGYDARQRPWFQDAVAAKGKLVVTTSYVSKTTGDYVIGFAKAVNENSGVIHFEVKLATIAEITKSIKIGNQGYAFILDRNQTFLAHPTSAIGSEAKAVQYDGMFKADSGTLSYLAAADGKPKKLNFVTNPLTGWKISGSWYDSESTQKAAPVFNKTAIVLAIAILLSAIAVVIIVRSISAPLGRLMGSMKRIADGN